MRKNVYSFLLLMIINTNFALCMKIKLQNPEYQDIKKELLNAVRKNSIANAIDTLQKFDQLIITKFGSRISEDTSHKNLIQQYEQDLLNEPKGKSALDIAFDNNNSEILLMLLEGSPIDYADFLKESGHLNPETDNKFKKIKSELIQAAASNNAKQTEKALKEFDEHINKPFSNLLSEGGHMIKNAYKKVLFNYIERLVQEPISIAVQNKSFASIYTGLRVFMPAVEDLLSQNLSIIKPIIGLNNQPVNALLDSIIIKQIGKYLLDTEATINWEDPDSAEYQIEPQGIEFLKNLKKIGLSHQKIQNLLVKTRIFYNSFFLYKPEKFKEYLTTELRKNKIIDDNFEIELKKEEDSQQLLYSIKKNRPLTDAYHLLAAPETNLAAVDINGDTALILAIKLSTPSNEFQKLSYKLAEKANINQPGEKGMTPLMHAVAQQNIDLIIFLLQKKVDLGAKDIFGQTALDYAKKKGNQEIIQVLEGKTKPESTTMSLQEQIVLLNSLSLTLNALSNKR